MGSMPTNCAAKNTADHTFLAAHNAPAYFLDNAAACRTQDVPLPATPSELDLSHKFTYIEANVPQSMHGCKRICGKTKWAQLAMGDTWAKTWIPALVASPEYQSGSMVIFVVWDQSTASGGQPGGVLRHLAVHDARVGLQHGVHALLAAARHRGPAGSARPAARG